MNLFNQSTKTCDTQRATSHLKLLVLLLLTLLGGYSSTVQSQHIPYQSDWLKGHYPARMQQFAKQPLKQGDIVFIGDSLTEEGKSWAHRFSDPRIQNRGISGDLTYCVLARLDELKAAKPKAIFLLIGINDIFNLYYEQEIQSLSSISENIEEITQQLHQALPETKIFVQSLLPDHRDFITMMAAAVNKQIQAIENKSFTYIDIHSAFVTSEGVMNPELTTDGTHLNPAGYKVWAEQLKPVLEALK